MPPLRVIAGYVSVALIWGSTWAAIKIGVNDVPPFVFAFARAVAVAAALTIVAVALRQPFPRGRRTMAVAMIVGLINTGWRDRKSTRLNSSHMSISYAVFCLKKKKKTK